MFNEKVNQYPLWAWVLVGMSAPVAQFASREQWTAVLIMAAACGGLCWGIHALDSGEPVSRRWYCAVEYLFLMLITGEFARLSASCWPTGGSYPIVPLTLLILAVFSALDGANRASRAGSVIFWFLALLYAVVLTASVKNLRGNWMMPALEAPSAFLIVVFLLPAVASFLPREKGGAAGIALTAIGIFAAVISLLTSGTMSQNAIKTLEDPFYEFSKSLSLFGVAERFEALISVALTLGYFAMLSFLLSAAGHLAERVRTGWGRPGVICCGAAGGLILLFCPRIASLWLAVLCVVLWGILPFTTLCWSKFEKSKKSEKGA